MNALMYKCSDLLIILATYPLVHIYERRKSQLTSKGKEGNKPSCYQNWWGTFLLFHVTSSIKTSFPVLLALGYSISSQVVLCCFCNNWTTKKSSPINRWRQFSNWVLFFTPTPGQPTNISDNISNASGDNGHPGYVIAIAGGIPGFLLIVIGIVFLTRRRQSTAQVNILKLCIQLLMRS